MVDIDFDYDENYVKKMLKDDIDGEKRAGLKFYESLLIDMITPVIHKMNALRDVLNEQNVSELERDKIIKHLAYNLAINIMYNFSAHKFDRELFESSLQEAEIQVKRVRK